MASPVVFVYEDRLSRHVLRPDHPLVPARLRYTYELLEAYRVFENPAARLVPPRPASEEEVLYFHKPEYVAAVRSFSRGEMNYDPRAFNFSDTGDNPIFPGMYEAALWSTGASLVAAELVASGEVDRAFSISGGLHHAMPSYASGFCIFNDPVIAIHALLKKGARVAYIDIDAHHGDGVQHAFYHSRQVLTISLHESGHFLFPGTGFVEEIGEGEGKGFSVNIPLYPYTGDDVYLWAFREVVPPLIRAFEPDVVVSQLGIDTYFRDPITHMALTVQGFARVVQEIGRLAPRWLALGGGGYDPFAVARAWTLAYGVMLGQELPDEIPASYQERYGVHRLRDPQPPALDPRLQEEARSYAQRSVEEVKRLVFPLHGL